MFKVYCPGEKVPLANTVLYVVVNSIAMNGYSGSTQFISITPAWINLLNGIRTGVGVSFGISALCFIASVIYLELNKRKEEQNEE